MEVHQEEVQKSTAFSLASLSLQSQQQVVSPIENACQGSAFVFPTAVQHGLGPFPLTKHCSPADPGMLAGWSLLPTEANPVCSNSERTGSLAIDEVEKKEWL